MTSPRADLGDVAEPLLTLLVDCDARAVSLFASAPILASLTADLIAREVESAQQVVHQWGSSRTALLARKSHVLRAAVRLRRQQQKRLDASFEAGAVSVEQLLVWADLARVGHDHDVGTPLTLLASPGPAPRVVLVEVVSTFTGNFASPSAGVTGSVTTGDGLRVVSAAGPGLEGFAPFAPQAADNQFSVVLAHTDGCELDWLTVTDVVVLASPLGDSKAGDLVPRLTTTDTGARLVPVPGAATAAMVCVTYGGLNDGIDEVHLMLAVCGVVLTNLTGDGYWDVRVRRNQCAAVGKHVGKLRVVTGHKYGMAVSTDEKWLAVGLQGLSAIYIYSFPTGKLVQCIGCEGYGPLQFKGLTRMCFAPNRNLVIVDQNNQRLQEVTIEGVFVRFIGVGDFGESTPFCVAVHDDVIAVGCAEHSGPRVVLFDFGTGAATSRFGDVGLAAGQLSKYCTGIRFTPDGTQLIVAEFDAKRLSVFTTEGVFVRCVGVGVLGGGFMDVMQSASGECVVADYRNNRVCVFRPHSAHTVPNASGSESDTHTGTDLVRSWGLGDTDAEFKTPIALAAAGKCMCVLGRGSARVHLFE